MANPITAIASRSCAKNSLLKQTEAEEKDDLTTNTGQTKSVSTTADVSKTLVVDELYRVIKPILQ